jgi:hypothetical protein
MIRSMIPLPNARSVKRVTTRDAHRVARSCSHVTLPDHPAAAGYRYHDLRGANPPFYVKRLAIADRSAAVTLRAPIELSNGEEAERGAPALARCELTIGLRRIPWEDVLEFDVHRGESAILAQRAMDELVGLNLLAADECPVCAA